MSADTQECNDIVHPGRAGHAAGATPRECSDRRRHALVHRHRCDQRRPALITPAPLSTATVTTNASALVHSSPDYAERDVLRIFHGATTKGGPWSGTDDWVSGKSWPVEWAHNSSTPRFSGVYTVRTTHTTNGSLPGLRISVSHRAANGSMLGRSPEQTIDRNCDVLPMEHSHISFVFVYHKRKSKKND